MRWRREQGNTLIELLAATVILGVISFALTESLISGFKNTGDTQDRLAGSVDRQRITAAFVPDVQSTQTYAQKPSAETLPCSGDREPIPGEIVHELGWLDGLDNHVAVYFVALVDGKSKLVRRLCVNDTPGGNDEVLADVRGAVEIGTLDRSLFLLKMGCPTDRSADCLEPDYEVAATRRVATRTEIVP